MDCPEELTSGRWRPSWTFHANVVSFMTSTISMAEISIVDTGTWLNVLRMWLRVRSSPDCAASVAASNSHDRQVSHGKAVTLVSYRSTEARS